MFGRSKQKTKTASRRTPPPRRMNTTGANHLTYKTAQPINYRDMIGKPASQVIDGIGNYEKAAPCTVMIMSVDANGQPTGLGSGVAHKSESGLLTFSTNVHVVGGADSLKVFIPKIVDGDVEPGTMEEALSARVLAMDPTADCAVVGLDDDSFDMPSLEIAGAIDDFGNVIPAGAPCFSLGYPFGAPNVYCEGKISARDRTLQNPDGHIIDGAMVTDAAINPGNSGGLLANHLGQMVGIPTWKWGGANIGAAIPVRILVELGKAVDVKNRVGMVEIAPGVHVVNTPFGVVVHRLNLAKMKNTTGEGIVPLVAISPDPTWDDKGWILWGLIPDLTTGEHLKGTPVIRKENDFGSVYRVLGVDGHPVKRVHDILAHFNSNQKERYSFDFGFHDPVAGKEDRRPIILKRS